MPNTGSFISYIRSEIKKGLNNNILIGDLVSVSPATRFATVKFSTIPDPVFNVVVLDDVNIADLQAGDRVLVFRLTGGLSIIIGSLSVSRTGPNKNVLVGGLRIGQQISGLPGIINFQDGAEYSTYDEYPIYDTYGNISSYDYTYSTYTDTYEGIYSEDHYAGEIWRYGNNLYAWESTYDCTYDSSYDIPAEWVRWDDARFIQGYPISDVAPADGQAPVFDEDLGMYVPDEVDCLVTVSAITPSPTYTGLAWLDTS